MSAEEYQRRFGSLARGPLARAEHKRSSPAPAATSKFGARSTVIDGIRFPSQREARRYTALQLLRASGEVLWFVRQPSFDLPGGTRYRADFLVVWRDGRVTVEDVKGFRTPAYVRSRKQVEALYPITIEEV
jgi:hypothetical protein